MKKENDILSMYNDIDDMINTIDIKDEDIIKDDEVKIEEEEETVIFIEDEIEENDSFEELIEEDTKDVITEEINIEEKEEVGNDNVEEVTEEISSSDKLKEIDEIFNSDNSTEEVIKKPKKNKKEKVKKEKKKSKAPIIVFAILDVIAIVCLFLMYGPISYFRNLWVTSAMTTMSHQYLAYIFFNGNQINDIMANNTVIEGDSETNEDDINISGEDNGVYSSIYEEQVLKRDPGNDIYKVIDIEGDGYKGHLLVVYDPSRIDLVQAPNLKVGGKQLETLVEMNSGLAGINASGFSYSEANGYVPTGVVIMDNEIISDGGDTGWSGGIIGFTNDNVLVLSKGTAYEALQMGVRDAVSFGPFLIINGEPSTFKGNGGYGIAPRTAIAQRKDGIVLLLVIDGRRPGHSLGVDMVELTNILLNYGAYNASNLDGGGSSSMVVDGEVISVAGGYGYTGERYIPNGWIVR